MRYMKTIVASVLVYEGLFMVILVLAQVFTGYDFSAAYSAVGAVGVVELALSAIIKREETKFEIKHRKDEENNE